ncbi:hypothetical protein Q3G72_008916 [Acer saccharum]|nr:hypothetical protein Q3G72_008916 [Acer saccharum]
MEVTAGVFTFAAQPQVVTMEEANDTLPDCNISSKRARSMEDVHAENQEQHDAMPIHEEAAKEDSPFGPWLLVSNRKYGGRYGTKGNTIYDNNRAGIGGKNYSGVSKTGGDSATNTTSGGKNIGGSTSNKDGRNKNRKSGSYGNRTEHVCTNVSKKMGGSRFEVLNEEMDETITDLDCQQNDRSVVKNGPNRKEVLSEITNQVNSHVKLGKQKKYAAQIEKKGRINNKNHRKAANYTSNEINIIDNMESQFVLRGFIDTGDGKGKNHDAESDSDDELDDPGVLQQLHRNVLAFGVLKNQSQHIIESSHDAFKPHTSSAETPGNMNQNLISVDDASFDIAASVLKEAMAVVIE